MRKYTLSSLFFSVLSWVRPLRWSSACSVADGEVSTGSLVAGDLCRAAEWRPVQRPELSVAAGEVLAGDLSPATFPVTVESPKFQFTASGRLWGSWARFVLFSFSGVGGRGFFLISDPCLLACLLMRGGYKRFVAIESKSFDLTIVGTAEDVLKISENGRGRRTSILLPEIVALWLLRAWGRFYKSNSSNWCNQVRQGSSIFLLESKRSRAGKFLELSVINEGKRTFVIFPAGWNERGWAKIFDALT
ncbi:hypothetical protein Cgig2_000576 [Carnegiea gigantea]|uniref:Uncharacterized protein n=1 Tax=Carnegiea gigantea TaxID=171969 RepID=A0A9Q1JMH5_9CARY|nr:hypothetical protein Cgig2_000576 [Carnegiea gigantea]